MQKPSELYWYMRCPLSMLAIIVIIIVIIIRDGTAVIIRS